MLANDIENTPLSDILIEGNRNASLQKQNVF
jgi:hypothetical protein